MAKGLNGDALYVKTYGSTYGINGDSKPVRGGQKWMVYYRKFHIKTFGSEADASQFADAVNNDSERKAAMVKSLTESDARKLRETSERLTVEGLVVRIGQLEGEVTKLLGVVRGLKQFAKKVQRRKSVSDELPLK